MSKNMKKQAKEEKEERAKAKKQSKLIFNLMIAIFVVGLGGYMFYDMQETSVETDLTLIGQGENIVVQVHDPT